VPRDEPLFILGAPRSGTSLVYKALCLHPHSAFISNWVRRYPAVPQLAAAYRIARRPSRLRRDAWFADGSNAYVYGRTRSRRERAFPTPVEGEPLFRRHGYTSPAEAPRPDRLAASCQSIARYAGGSTFVSKRIANNRRVPLLDAAFPRARYLVVVRDGRAVSASLARVDWWDDTELWWWNGGTPRDWARTGRHPMEACARHWVAEVRAVESGLVGIESSRVRQVSYETLVADLVGELDAIRSFAGFAHDPAWLREVEALSSHSESSWRRRLTDDDLASIEGTVGQELEARGYGLVTS
jgi:hypothetical protein